MKFEVDTQVPFGNACDIALTTDDGTLTLSFSPDPHGGPETLWFCFRLLRTDATGPDISTVRLQLKHSYNMLGGQNPLAMRPVIRYDGGEWRRLPEGDLITLADGRTDVAWSTAVPNRMLDVAFCYPYGMEELEALMEANHGTWQLDTIGVSQSARPLLRLSNAYGRPDGGQLGLYLMARQHSGETPGSWVLDGFLRAIADLGRDAPLVWAVPLSNIDGIEGGDYGKDNFPYDLNRAWGRPPMRHEVSVIQRDMARWRSRCLPVLAIDFHAPGASETGGVYTYVPDPDLDRGGHDAVMRWANWTSDALTPEYAADDFARVARYPSRWETPSFRAYAWAQIGVPCITYETPYAIAQKRVLTQEDYREIGHRICKGVLQGLNRLFENG
jgi:hypothetical protein